MTTKMCDRCGGENYYLEPCGYCKKNICNACKKATKRSRKIKRSVICKDCWGNISKRSVFKSIN